MGKVDFCWNSLPPKGAITAASIPARNAPCPCGRTRADGTTRVKFKACHLRHGESLTPPPGCKGKVVDREGPRNRPVNVLDRPCPCGSGKKIQDCCPRRFTERCLADAKERVYGALGLGNQPGDGARALLAACEGGAVDRQGPRKKEIP